MKQNKTCHKNKNIFSSKIKLVKETTSSLSINDWEKQIKETLQKNKKL